MLMIEADFGWGITNTANSAVFVWTLYKQSVLAADHRILKSESFSHLIQSWLYFFT